MARRDLIPPARAPGLDWRPRRRGTQLGGESCPHPCAAMAAPRTPPWSVDRGGVCRSTAILLLYGAAGFPGDIQDIPPEGWRVKVSNAGQHLQVSNGKKRRHKLRVVNRDGAVRVAVPEADWALNRRVLQSGRSRHQSPVLDQPVGAIPGGFGKSIADCLIYARFAEECAICWGNISFENP